jgi:anaerobic selenocysteine-containing dehydrogenase
MQGLIRTSCTRDCPNTCGLIAEVEDDICTKLYGNSEHPLNQGRVCTKCQRYLDRVYHPHRALYPLHKVDGEFSRLSWRNALDIVAAHIKQVVAEHGASSILYYQGFGARTALKLINRRFFNLVGPVSFLEGTSCGGTGQASQDLDFGERISHDFRDYANSGSLIIWGRNPAVTNINLVPAIKGVQRRGGVAVLIDPLDTKTADMCELHIRPRPGSDVWLALALARVLFEAQTYDEEFLTQHCTGYEAYRKIVFTHSLTELSGRCDVPLAQIQRLAAIIAEHKPVGFLLGWGLHRWEYAHLAIRAIDALGALAGSIGVSGGGVSQGFEEYQPYDWDIWGDALNPGSRRMLMPTLAQELERADPPIEMLFVTAGNPLVMLPNSNRIRKAFERIPFKVVMGQFLDDTACTADVFLPSTTFLEEYDVVASYGHSYVGPVTPVIQSLGKSKSDFQMFMELGSRFDFADDYVKSAEDWLKIILRPTLERGVTFEQITGGGVFAPDVPAVPYQDGRFPTPSGRFQLIEALDMPEPEPLGEEYHLLSTAPFNWLCSELNPKQFKGPLPVRINSDEAAKWGLADDDLCTVSSDFGSLTCQTVCSDSQRRDLVLIPRGGWGILDCNVNVLTRDLVSKVGKGTPYYETRVRIRRLGTVEQ